jgi:hypothetical protein
LDDRLREEAEMAGIVSTGLSDFAAQAKERAANDNH